MAYPVTEELRNSTSNGNTVTSLVLLATVNAPIAGELLIVAIGSDDATDTDQFSINTTNYPGWVKIGESGDSSVDAHFAYFGKISTGGELSVQVDLVSSDECQGNFQRISGHNVTDIAADIGWNPGTDTASPWQITGVTGLDSGTEYLMLGGMSMDGGDGGAITVAAIGGWTKTTHVNSGTSGNDNMGCYAKANFTGGTTSAVCTFTTADKTDGAALGQIAIPAATGAVTVSPTGVAGTGEVDTATVTGIGNIPVTSTDATAAGQVGDVTVAIKLPVDVPVTGLAGIGEVDTVIATGDANVPVTGLSSAGEVGSVTVDTHTSVDVPVTGLSHAGEVGSVTVSTSAGTDVPVTGVAATGEVDSVSVTGIANVVTTGLAAAGTVGDVIVATEGNITVPVTGVSATGEVGQVTIDSVQSADVPVTGVSAAGQAGEVTVVGVTHTVVSVTGVFATTAVGTVTVAQTAIVYPTGLEASADVGSVTAIGTATVQVAGLAAVGEVGSPSVSTGHTVVVTGVVGTGAVGQVSITLGGTKVFPTGVEASGYAGDLFIVARHVPNQTPDYDDLDPTQDPNYTPISPTDGSEWVEIKP